MRKRRKRYYLYPIIIILMLLIIYFLSELLAIIRLGLTDVYIASTDIYQREKIEEDYLEKIKVPKAYINDDVLVNLDDIVGKYVRLEAYIPKGSLIYKDSVDNIDSMKDLAHLDLKENEVTYDLFVRDIKVNPAHLVKGMNVNIYLTINKKEVISDELISNVRITGLYDVNNEEIKDYERDVTLSTISIALNKEYVPYLNKAIVIGEVSLIVGSDLYEDKESKLNSTSYLMKYLMVE